MKKLYYKLAVSALITLIALTTLMAVVVFVINFNSMTTTLRQMILQAEDRYYLSWRENKTSVGRQEADYLNRASTVSFMIQQDKSFMNHGGLEELRDRVEVKEIYLFDRNGDIMYTTNRERRGGHVQEGTTLEKYILNPKAAEYAIYWRPSDTGEKSQSCSIAMKPQNAPFYAILIEMEEGVYRVMTDDAIMRETLERLLSDYDTTVFAFSNLSNKIVGMTSNNPQKFQSKDVWGNDIDLLQSIRNLKNGTGCLRMESGDVIAVAMEFGDYTLVGFSSMSVLFVRMFLPLSIMLGVALIFGAMTYRRTRYYWEHYLLSDLRGLESDIYRVLGGDFQVDARCVNNEDLNSLAEAFNLLKEGYEHREERLSRIANCLGGGLAIFDCVQKNGLTFFSDNMQEILGLTRKEWSELRDDYQAFTALLDQLKKGRDENGLVRFQSRHLKLQMAKDKNGVSGIILDASTEVARRNELMSELNRAENAVRKDAMTGLLNRTGFEEEVIRHLSETHPTGVMLMMDMDDFKNVNDTLGHPEGDRLLRLVGESLKNIFRKSDAVAHFGGDEFAVFLPDTFSLAELEHKLSEVLERLREDMKEYHDRCGVTMSIGAAFAGEGNYANLYQVADSALYIAKRMGKDCYYINAEGITCMRVECIACREKCPRREALGLSVTDAYNQKQTARQAAR